MPVLIGKTYLCKYENRSKNELMPVLIGKRGGENVLMSGNDLISVHKIISDL